MDAPLARKEEPSLSLSAIYVCSASDGSRAIKQADAIASACILPGQFVGPIAWVMSFVR